MAQSRGLKEAILIGSGALLVLLIVLLLFSLKITPVEETELEPAAPARVSPQPSAPRPHPAVLASPDPGVGSETAEIRAPPRPPVKPEILPEPPPAGEAPRAYPAPNIGHVAAPAAEPPNIDNEPDPKRRAVLRKMHELAMSTLRVDNFKRRIQLLEQSLAEAKASNTWTNKKVDRAEQDLKQLEHTIKAANEERAKLKKEMDSDLGGETLPSTGSPPR